MQTLVTRQPKGPSLIATAAGGWSKFFDGSIGDIGPTITLLGNDRFREQVESALGRRIGTAPVRASTINVDIPRLITTTPFDPEFREFRNLLPRGVKLAPEDVWERCAYLLSVKIEEPQFSGQTKERLTSRP